MPVGVEGRLTMAPARKPSSRTPKKATASTGRPPAKSPAAKRAPAAAKRTPGAAKRAPAAAKRTTAAARRTPAAAKSPSDRRPTTPRKRPAAGKRRPPARRPPRRPFEFEQRHAEVLGLGLVAVGVFLTVTLYTSSDGGHAGRAITTALAWLLGEIRYAVPPAAVAVGVVLVLRPVLPSVRPLRTGTILLFAALTLALAADTLGIGPGGARHGVLARVVLRASRRCRRRSRVLDRRPPRRSGGGRHPRGLPRDRRPDPAQRRRSGRPPASRRSRRARRHADLPHRPAGRLGPHGVRPAEIRRRRRRRPPARRPRRRLERAPRPRRTDLRRRRSAASVRDGRADRPARAARPGARRPGDPRRGTAALRPRRRVRPRR